MAGSTEARPVGYVFKPTEEQLVGHFLKKKLEGEMQKHRAIPEIYIYEWEAPQLFTLYDGLSEEPSNERECFCFCDGGRRRKTPLGYWKETGRKRTILASNTDRPIGFKKIFVYHEGRQPRGRRTDVVNHEYHYLNSNGETSDRTVLCRIMKRKSRGARSAIARASAGLHGARGTLSAVRRLTVVHSRQVNPGVMLAEDPPPRYHT